VSGRAVVIVVRCGLVRRVLVLPAVETAVFAALMPWLRVTARTAVCEVDVQFVCSRSRCARMSGLVEVVTDCLLVWSGLKQETRPSQTLT
jgi:hypothetical protein